MALAGALIPGCGVIPGVQAASNFSTVPASMMWSSVSVGRTGTPQTATITNTGSQSINIENIGFSGADPADFSVIGNTCGAALPPSAACTATVVFKPTATGSRAATLAVSDTGGGIPQQVSLLGTGASPAALTSATLNATAAPGAITWANVAVGQTGGPKSATLTNDSSQAITISKIAFTGSNPGDFSIYKKTCGTSLAASASCTATVVFRPTTSGSRAADLSFTTSASNSPQQVAVSGNATSSATTTGSTTASPSSITWGSVAVGNAGGPKAATLTNSGSASIAISSIGFTGTNAGDFAIYQKTCGSTLGASSSCTATVLFKPTASGTRTATLVFTDSDGNSPQEVSLSGLGTGGTGTVAASPTSLSFGSIAAGSTSAAQSISVTNTTSASVTLSPSAISGANAGEFSVSSTTCGSTLAASASCSASIDFSPNSSGSATAVWNITSSNSPTPLSVSLSGTGTTSAGSAAVSPTSLSWGSVSVGNAGGQKSATLTNNGTSAIDISGITFAGADPGDFSIFKNTCGSALAASASCAATILFKPTVAGTRTATLNFTDSAGNSPQQVSLSGLGTGGPATGNVTASPSSLSFGTVNDGTVSQSQSITISNSTTGSVTLSADSITGANAGDFAVSSTTCGSSLAASASCTESLVFSPGTVGADTATWNITSSNSSTPLSVFLSGTGASSSGPGSGTTYYVSNCGTVGNDSNDGTSPSTAWKTIAKVNSSTFKPGDNIDFRDGCTWREQLTLPSAGTASNPITIGTFGSGTAPVISGSVVASSWTSEAQAPVNFTGDSHLQGYWDMDQMSGSSFLDATNNGNTLTNTNGVTQSTNNVQGTFSAAFNPANKTMLSRSDTALSSGFVGKSGSTNANVTIGGWIYVNSISSNATFFMKGAGKAWGLFLGVGSNLGKMEWQTFLDSGFREVASNNALTPNTWYHVVGRVNAATNEQAIFINGVKQSQTYKASSATMFTDSTPIQIGGSSSGTYLNGNVDELFVFNRALSDSEIASLYNGRLDGSSGSYTLYYTTGFSEPVTVYENGVAMNYVAEKGGMTPGSWSWDSANSRVYIRPTGDVDPSSETFEIPQRLYCIADFRSYTILNGLTCQEPSQKGVYVTAAHVTVQNMLIKDVRWNSPSMPNNNGDGVGIFWEGSNDVIQDNTVRDANWGIFSYDVAGQTIDSAMVQRNTVYNIGFDGIGLAVAHPSGGVISNTVAQYNIVHDIGIFNLEGGGLECIFAGSTIGQGNAIRYNTVFHNGTPSLHAYPLNVQGGAGSCSFYGNIIYNNFGPCLEIAGGPGGNHFYNNVCYNNGLAGGEGAGFFLTGGSNNSGNVIENNIVDAGSATTFVNDSSGTTSNTLDYNIYFGGTATPFIWNGIAGTFSGYLAASGEDSHSINADPQFTNPSANDFSLTSTSPAIGAGLNLGATYQLDLAPGSTWPDNVNTANQNSNGAWDIGAYVHP
ncbi:MAG TPA: choice-of-anchor D domain-containing protein [Silvibacterium sp.]|nr:choice-of-anchor D domain-containing protein [Silvibacterium sp.]